MRGSQFTQPGKGRKMFIQQRQTGMEYFDELVLKLKQDYPNNRILP